jgi:hypothetical protein
MELVISAMDSENAPTVLFGFHSPEFSQCVYMTVDEDPIACLKMAEEMADSFVKACGEAVQKHRMTVAKRADDYQREEMSKRDDTAEPTS